MLNAETLHRGTSSEMSRSGGLCPLSLLSGADLKLGFRGLSDAFYCPCHVGSLLTQLLAIRNTTVGGGHGPQYQLVPTSMISTKTSIDRPVASANKQHFHSKIFANLQLILATTRKFKMQSKFTSTDKLNLPSSCCFPILPLVG